MTELVNIYNEEDHMQILYGFLSERTPEQSISHKEMPSIEDHIDFVDSEPYLAWYFIVDDFQIVGSVYLTKQREIGISIGEDWRGCGYGSAAVKMLMERHPGKFLANINPDNDVSIKFFAQFGAKHIQNTYEF